MLGQAMQPQFTIAPFVVLLVIGAALFVAVAIVIMALAKSGKAAGVVALLFAVGMFFMLFFGLAIPYVAARRAGPPQIAPPVMVAPQQLQMREWPEPVVRREETIQLLPLHQESSPPPPVSPPHDAHAAAPEVTTEHDMEITAEAASPSDESSASPEEATPAPAELTAAPRPEWMKEALTPTRDFVERRVIHIERYSTIDELQTELPAHLRDAMNEFMAKNIDYSAPDLVKLPPGYVVDHGILADRWTEVHSPDEHASLGQTMYSLHVLLQFDKNVRNDLQVRYEQAKVGYRLGAFGVGGGLLLSLLATLYGYLKLDTLTKGFYTGRLRLAAGLTGASAATAAAALMAEGVVRWI